MAAEIEEIEEAMPDISTKVSKSGDTMTGDLRFSSGKGILSSAITAMTGYTKPSSTSAITTSDTLNQAIGKLERGLEDAGGGSQELEEHIETNVEDDGGVHGIRCHEGSLQVYNAFSQEWCDPSEIGVITANVSGLAVYQRYHFLEIKWSDPSDSLWEGTKVVMKEGSYPQNENDGQLVCDNKEKNAYSTTPLFLYDLDPSITYYFQLFPYTKRGSVNRDTANRASGTPLASKSATYYVYNLVGSTSGGGYVSPAYGGSNSTFTPASLNDDGTFFWGSWKDAWFIPRPCMLKYDGTVDYYLDPDDYTKKEDGTPSDVANLNYEGNAMMEWPEMYYSLSKNGYDGLAGFYTSDTSGSYHRSKFYTAIYNCTGIEKLRSISGITTNTSMYNYSSRANVIEKARANNTGNSAIWHIELISDKMIIAMLLVLLSRRINTQATYGLGMVNTTYTAMNNYITGTLNDKGLFYGSKTDGTVPVKIFGMENYWGHSERLLDGLSKYEKYIYFNFNVPNADGTLPTTGKLYYQYTLGAYTTSTINFDSSDYMLCVTNYGIFPPHANHGSSVSRSKTTGLCDRYALDYKQYTTYYATTGGNYSSGEYAGAFYINTNSGSGYASLTCRLIS